MLGKGMNIDLAWSMVVSKINTAQMKTDELRNQLEQENEEKFKAERSLEATIEEINHSGILDDIENDEMLDAILSDKIIERDAKFRFISQGAKKIFEETYNSYTNVMNSRIQNHNQSLLSIL